MQKIIYKGFTSFLLITTLTQSVIFSQSPIIINEVMSVNKQFVSDEDGAFSDWIELYNNSNEAVNLDGYGLSDDISSPFKWIFPEIEIEANEYLMIWASGKDKKHTGKREVNGIYRHYYPNILGSSVDDLLNSPQFPNSPQTIEIIRSHFEAPTNVADNYGQHMFTWIEAPLSGEYIFWIAGDDNSRLYISTDETPEKADLIAEVPGWTNAREWNKYPEQESKPIYLEKGKRYYLSALMKEATGGDNLSVRWMFPNNTINEPLSAEYCFLEVKNLHTNFRISGEGEKVILTNPAGSTIDSMPKTVLPPNISLGRIHGEFTKWVYFETPTPGKKNSTPYYTEILEKPIITKESAVYSSTSKPVSISAPEGEIYYTTNGSMPSPTNGIRYTSPFTISNSSLIRAIAVDPNKINSQVAAASFIKTSSYSQNFKSEIPIMVIQHFDQTITDYNEADAYMTLIDCDVNQVSDINSNNYLQSRIKINYRGSSSLYFFPKKGYGFHLIDEAGHKRKEPLLGMPEEHNWILHGPYSDKTLMRNELSYHMSEETGHYAPRTRFVELFMHSGNQPLSEAQNHGIYLLVERIKIADGRLDLNGLETHNDDYPSITGGYIFKNDRLNEGEKGFTSSRGSLLAHVRPNEQTITPAQSNYLVQYIDSLETALRLIPMENEKKSYTKYIDTQSFIDLHIVTEVCKEIDGYRYSTFLHKDRGGKIKMGPVWDFNLSLGNANYFNAWIATGWYYPLISTYEYIFGWYNYLFSDEAFDRAYKTRYRVLRQGALSTQRLSDKIIQNAELLTQAQQRDQKKWNTIGTHVWPNWYVGSSYEGEINFMLNWLEKRLEWTDQQLGKSYSLLHYWNFDNTDVYDKTFFTTNEASMSITPGANTEIARDNSKHFKGGNSRLFSQSDSHLRLNNPTGSTISFDIPSTGYENTAFSFEALRSTNGANTLYIEYSIDGLLYEPLDTVYLTTVPIFYTQGFSHLEGTSDNPYLSVRISIDNHELRLGGDRGNVRIDNVTLDGDALPGTNLPPLQVADLPEVLEVTKGETLSINLDNYFSDPENDEITYHIEPENSTIFGASAFQSELLIDAFNTGNGHLTLSVSDNYNPAFEIPLRVLVYPEPVELAYSDYTFNTWSMQSPAGTFPDHMVFLQSETADPGIKTPLQYAYHIPETDYAESDAGNIGFPYRNNSRTRINGLGPAGIMFVNTGRDRDLGAALLSINTLGCDEVFINWESSTMKANSREYAIRPQYRIGLKGEWMNFYDNEGILLEYKRSHYEMLKEQFSGMKLPEEAINRELVQIAWRYYNTGRRNNLETGARDYLALHQISVRNEKMNSFAEYININSSTTNFFSQMEKKLHLNKSTSGNIFNTLGQKVGSFKNEKNIDVSQLQSGVYLCMPKKEEGFRFVVY